MSSCRFSQSVFCPFDYCIASSIEDCNLRSGRFTSRFGGRISGVSPVVLSPAKFAKRRVV